jgi:hypothetical protein
MSRSSERERARLYGAPQTPLTDTSISSGLTYGGHGTVEIDVTSPEKERIVRGILGEPGGRRIESGLTYGDPRDAAAAAARDNAINAQGAALNERENFDANELQMRREVDLLASAAEEINLAAMNGWNDPVQNAKAAAWWQSMTTVQRATLVRGGDVTEEDADYVHGAVWPAVAQAAVAHNAEATRIAVTTQKAIALMRIRQERRADNDPAWTAHQQAVFAKAREKGLDLSDERLGSQAFEDQFRAAEVVLAEDARALAVAQFGVDVLDASSTDVASGLRVLGANGWQSTIEGGPVIAKPNYERALDRAMGGDSGGHDPALDTAEDIRAGVLTATGPSESKEWRDAQHAAGELFNAEQKASIERKLGVS